MEQKNYNRNRNEPPIDGMAPIHARLVIEYETQQKYRQSLI